MRVRCLSLVFTREGSKVNLLEEKSWGDLVAL